MLTPTPIEKQHLLASVFDLDIDLRIKRDDLFPMPGGGIKSRKIQYIMNDALEKGHDVLVTNGGTQSNHARSAALLAAGKGIDCHLVIVLEPGIKYPVTGNLLLMQMSGATMEYCRKDQLAGAMDNAIEHYKQLGRNPAYIWGGGHNYAGTHAFVDAAAEVQKQCGNWVPDYVVLASGTGSTQAGLAIGYSDFKTKVIGVSVARGYERGARIIRKCIDDYYKTSGFTAPHIDIHFKDNWTFGGYEKSAPVLLDAVSRAAKAGIILDLTYSGKGFYGLIEMVRIGDIPKGSKVLFWHSGGLLNLMASSFAEGFISI